MEEKINRIWVPSTTEIFTEDGWLSIGYAFHIKPMVFTADLKKGKVVLQAAEHWATREFDGKINRLTEGLLKIEYKTASLVKKTEVLNLHEDDTPQVAKQVNYSGTLYSFDTENGTAMLRYEQKADKFATRAMLDLVEFEMDEGDYVNMEFEDMDYDSTPETGGLPDYWMSLTRW